MDDNTIYGVLFELQKPEIDRYCFDECGKIIIGAIMTDFGSFLPCRKDDCPYEEKRSPNGYLTEFGDTMYIRKLKPWKE